MLNSNDVFFINIITQKFIIYPINKKASIVYTIVK